MNIRLQQLMPYPLEDQNTTGSEVWGVKDLHMTAGQSYIIGSPSGKGKSTLLGILFGLRRDYHGTVSLGDHDLASLSLAEWAQWRQSKISMVFQGLRLFGHLNGWENLKVKNKLTGFRSQDELNNVATQLGIIDLMERPCSTWSFGQRQRLAIIRAMSQPFEWLLLDEPFSHLDTENTDMAYRLIRQTCEQQSAGLIVTSLGEEQGLSFDHSISL